MSKWLTINDLAWWTRGLLPHQPGGLARNRRQGRRAARAGRGGRGLRTGRPPAPRVRGTPPGPPGRGVQTRGARRRTRQHDVATIELHHGETPRAGTSRQEIQAGRESSARQMAEIRRFIFDLFSEDEDDNEEDTRKWSNLAPYYGGERLPPGRTLPSTAPRRIVPESRPRDLLAAGVRAALILPICGPLVEVGQECSVASGERFASRLLVPTEFAADTVVGSDKRLPEKRNVRWSCGPCPRAEHVNHRSSVGGIPPEQGTAVSCDPGVPLDIRVPSRILKPRN